MSSSPQGPLPWEGVPGKGSLGRGPWEGVERERERAMRVHTMCARLYVCVPARPVSTSPPSPPLSVPRSHVPPSPPPPAATSRPASSSQSIASPALSARARKRCGSAACRWSSSRRAAPSCPVIGADGSSPCRADRTRLLMRSHSHASCLQYSTVCKHTTENSGACQRERERESEGGIAQCALRAG